jgi:hypothetical protein
VTVLAVVTFPAAALPAEALRRLLEDAAPRYLVTPGLRRKYFLHAPGLGGGAYEWASRADAERFYDAAWHARMRVAAGAPPRIEWFEVAAIADAVAGRIEYTS